MTSTPQENPLAGAGAVILDCACPPELQRMDFGRVMMAIDCASCGRVAYGLANHNLTDVARALTLAWEMMNLPAASRPTYQEFVGQVFQVTDADVTVLYERARQRR